MEVEIFNYHSPNQEFVPVGSNVKYNMAGLDAVLLNGPAAYMNSCEKTKVNGITTYDYEEVWKCAIQKKTISGIKTYFGKLGYVFHFLHPFKLFWHFGLQNEQ